MRRGDVAIVAQRGLYEGKPRPAVVIQLDELLDVHPSVLVFLLTSDPRAANGAFYRIPVAPTAANGLREPSVIMADRIVTIGRDGIRDTVGRLEPASIVTLDRALALFQGLL